jgi:Flp pilus assembly protein CpaB
MSADNQRKSLSLSKLLAILALFIGLFGSVYLFNNEAKNQVAIQVPKRDLPAYYLIKPGDFILKKYSQRELHSNTLKEKDSQKIEGRYTLTKLSKEKPFNEKQISSNIDPAHLNNTVAIAIPATTAMTLNGSLEAGDIVDITLVPAANKISSSPSAIVFSDILVLDVKSITQGTSSFTYVIVIALPLQLQQEFATQTAKATLLISRKL